MASIKEVVAKGAAHGEGGELDVGEDPFRLSCVAHEAGDVLQLATASCQGLRNNRQEREAERVLQITNEFAVLSSAAGVATGTITVRQCNLERVKDPFSPWKRLISHSEAPGRTWNHQSPPFPSQCIDCRCPLDPQPSPQATEGTSRRA